MYEDYFKVMFVAEFAEIATNNSIRAQVNDSDLICNILLSLPKIYETISRVIKNTSNITFMENCL